MAIFGTFAINYLSLSSLIIYVKDNMFVCLSWLEAADLFAYLANNDFKYFSYLSIIFENDFESLSY